MDYRSSGLSGRGILTDIAPGGVHISRTTAPVSLNQQLSLRLWLCRGQLTLELPAVVVRVEEAGFAAALPYSGPDLDEALGFAIRRLIPRESSSRELERESGAGVRASPEGPLSGVECGPGEDGEDSRSDR